MSSFQIRPLRADEIEAFARNSHYAFDGRSVEQRLADFGRRIAPERNCLVACDDDSIVSQVMIYEFAVWLNGVKFPTGGLANVVTIPEKGGVGTHPDWSPPPSPGCVKS